MNDILLKAELDNDPQSMGYNALGWSDSLPSITGNPPNGTPFTSADNEARYVQAEKYQAIANRLNDPTRRPKRASRITDADVYDALDKAEWRALSAGDREFFQLLRDVGSKRWRQEISSILSPNGATRTVLSALKESRTVELGLGKVKAGDIKRVRGDNI